MSNDNKDSEDRGAASVLGDEPDTSRSLAACLRLAKTKGYLDTDKRKSSVVISSVKKAKLEAKSYTIEEKKDDSYQRRSRNVQLREVKEPEDYKPEINLEYTDDSGHKLETPKEAFRHLCHKFHGKGPGKNKIDKTLRKQAMENKLKETLSKDEPLPSLALMAEKQKELKTPYIILSKGK